MGKKPLLESVKFCEGIVECEVASEFRFKGRSFEAFGMKKVQLLAVSDVEPGGLNVDIARTGNLVPAERIEKELTYPGEVRVTVIREARVTEIAR